MYEQKGTDKQYIYINRCTIKEELTKQYIYIKLFVNRCMIKELTKLYIYIKPVYEQRRTDKTVHLR